MGAPGFWVSELAEESCWAFLSPTWRPFMQIIIITRTTLLLFHKSHMCNPDSDIWSTPNYAICCSQSVWRVENIQQNYIVRAFCNQEQTHCWLWQSRHAKALFPGTPARTEINNHFISHGFSLQTKWHVCLSVYVVSTLDKDRRRFHLQKRERERNGTMNTQMSSFTMIPVFTTHTYAVTAPHS